MPLPHNLYNQLRFNLGIISSRIEREFPGMLMGERYFGHDIYSRENMEDNPQIIQELITTAVRRMDNTAIYTGISVVLYDITIDWHVGYYGYIVGFVGIQVPYKPEGLYRNILVASRIFTIQTTISQMPQHQLVHHQLPTSHGCVSS